MNYPVISIQQPWPEAILSLGKDVENRTWRCPKKHLNKTVLIHAGRKIDEDAFVARPELRPLIGKQLPTGGIVGCMKITDGDGFCHKSKWAAPLCFSWSLAEVRRLEFYPCMGQLGFFVVDYPWRVAACC